MNTKSANDYQRTRWENRLWNVRLWIFNEEPLYRMAIECIRSTSGPEHLHDAAELFCDNLGHDGITETPDGYRYTPYVVLAVMEELYKELKETNND